MVPGDSLEFGEGRGFKTRLKGVPELGAAVIQHLRQSPNAGDEICGGLKAFKLEQGGKVYKTIYKRLRNRVALIEIFELPRQQRVMDEALADLKKTYCK